MKYNFYNNAELTDSMVDVYNINKDNIELCATTTNYVLSVGSALEKQAITPKEARQYLDAIAPNIIVLKNDFKRLEQSDPEYVCNKTALDSYCKIMSHIAPETIQKNDILVMLDNKLQAIKSLVFYYREINNIKNINLITNLLNNLLSIKTNYREGIITKETATELLNAQEIIALYASNMSHSVRTDFHTPGKYDYVVADRAVEIFKQDMKELEIEPEPNKR